MVRAALPGPVPVLIVAALNGPTINFSGPVRIDVLASCKPANYGFTGTQKAASPLLSIRLDPRKQKRTGFIRSLWYTVNVRLFYPPPVFDYLWQVLSDTMFLSCFPSSPRRIVFVIHCTVLASRAVVIDNG